MKHAGHSEAAQTEPRLSAPINFCLNALDRDILSLLSPNLKLVDLGQGEKFNTRSASPPLIMFPNSGILTLFYGEYGQKQSAVAIIGHEGIANYHLLFPFLSSPYELVVQASGQALAISSEVMKQLLLSSWDLQSVFISYAVKMHSQIAATLRSSLQDTIRKRLARLLLMYHDRIKGDEIPISHNTMATVLSVRRASVTEAMHLLEGHHAVYDLRGRTTIKDRDVLISFAAGSYGQGDEIRV